MGEIDGRLGEIIDELRKLNEKPELPEGWPAGPRI
jgi:hypothetical protein